MSNLITEHNQNNDPSIGTNPPPINPDGLAQTMSRPLPTEQPGYVGPTIPDDQIPPLTQQELAAGASGEPNTIPPTAARVNNGINDNPGVVFEETPFGVFPRATQPFGLSFHDIEDATRFNALNAQNRERQVYERLDNQRAVLYSPGIYGQTLGLDAFTQRVRQDAQRYESLIQRINQGYVPTVGDIFREAVPEAELGLDPSRNAVDAINDPDPSGNRSLGSFLRGAFGVGEVLDTLTSLIPTTGSRGQERTGGRTIFGIGSIPDWIPDILTDQGVRMPSHAELNHFLDTTGEAVNPRTGARYSFGERFTESRRRAVEGELSSFGEATLSDLDMRRGHGAYGSGVPGMILRFMSIGDGVRALGQDTVEMFQEADRVSRRPDGTRDWGAYWGHQQGLRNLSSWWNAEAQYSFMEPQRETDPDGVGGLTWTPIRAGESGTFIPNFFRIRPGQEGYIDPNIDIDTHPDYAHLTPEDRQFVRLQQERSREQINLAIPGWATGLVLDIVTGLPIDIFVEQALEQAGRSVNRVGVRRAAQQAGSAAPTPSAAAGAVPQQAIPDPWSTPPDPLATANLNAAPIPQGQTVGGIPDPWGTGVVPNRSTPQVATPTPNVPQQAATGTPGVQNIVPDPGQVHGFRSNFQYQGRQAPMTPQQVQEYIQRYQQAINANRAPSPDVIQGLRQADPSQLPDDLLQQLNQQVPARQPGVGLSDTIDHVDAHRHSPADQTIHLTEHHTLRDGLNRGSHEITHQPHGAIHVLPGEVESLGIIPREDTASIIGRSIREGTPLSGSGVITPEVLGGEVTPRQRTYPQWVTIDIEAFPTERYFPDNYQLPQLRQATEELARADIQLQLDAGVRRGLAIEQHNLGVLEQHTQDWIFENLDSARRTLDTGVHGQPLLRERIQRSLPPSHNLTLEQVFTNRSPDQIPGWRRSDDLDTIERFAQTLRDNVMVDENGRPVRSNRSFVTTEVAQERVQRSSEDLRRLGQRQNPDISVDRTNVEQSRARLQELKNRTDQIIQDVEGARRQLQELPDRLQETPPVPARPPVEIRAVPDTVEEVTKQYNQALADHIRQWNPELESVSIHMTSLDQIDVRHNAVQMVEAIPNVRFNHYVDAHGTGSIVDGTWSIQLADGNRVNVQRFVDENYAPGSRVMVIACSNERLAFDSSLTGQWVLMTPGNNGIPLDAGEVVIRRNLAENILDRLDDVVVRQMTPEQIARQFNTEIPLNRIPRDTPEGRLLRLAQDQDFSFTGRQRFYVESHHPMVASRHGMYDPGYSPLQIANTSPRRVESLVRNTLTNLSIDDAPLIAQIEAVTRIEAGLKPPTRGFNAVPPGTTPQQLAREIYQELPLSIQQRADFISQMRQEPLAHNHIIQASRAYYDSHLGNHFIGSRVVLDGQDMINSLGARDLGVRLTTESNAERFALSAPADDMVNPHLLDAPVIYQSMWEPDVLDIASSDFRTIYDAASMESLGRYVGGSVNNGDDMMRQVASSAQRHGQSVEEAVNNFRQSFHRRAKDRGYQAIPGADGSTILFDDIDLMPVRRLRDVPDTQTADAIAADLARLRGDEGLAGQHTRRVVQDNLHDVSKQMEVADNRVMRDLDNLDSIQRQADSLANEQRTVQERVRLQEAREQNVRNDLRLANEYDPEFGKYDIYC
jgi:hypothetical protein